MTVIDKPKWSPENSETQKIEWISEEWKQIINNISNSVFDLVSNNSLWNIFRELRENWDFKEAQIDEDWAIDWIISLLKEYNYDFQNENFIKRFADLANLNTCPNLWNDWFEVYVQFLNKVWIKITKEDLKEIAGKKRPTEISPKVMPLN